MILPCNTKPLKDVSKRLRTAIDVLVYEKIKNRHFCKIKHLPLKYACVLFITVFNSYDIARVYSAKEVHNVYFETFLDILGESARATTI